MSSAPLIRERSIDDRERLLLDRALRELGFELTDFRVEISPLPPDERERSLPGGSFVLRESVHAKKEVIVRRISSGESYRQEQDIDGPWAGEVVQALIHGILGGKG